MTDSPSAVDVAFHPRAVAVAGVSAARSGWGGGLMFLRATRRFGRVERVHALNPKGGELDDGTPIYRSLRDVPGEVDYLISAVPASAILGLVDDAIAKGVKVLHLFTAGFSETGDAERSGIEEEVMRRLRGAGIRMIGPNCMGVHSPIGGVSWMEEASDEIGRVGVVSQSGMHASDIVRAGEQRSLRFSYVVSFGNATDLNESDYFDYLAANDETDLVLAYLEGIKDGPRFIRAARRLAGRKPLVVLKGGATEAGSRAANSHTGSLAGSAAIWEAVRKQTGFISVRTPDELLDEALTIQHLAAIAGPRVGIVGGGGGTSVLAADACDRAGLLVPALRDETQRRLAEWTPAAGTSVRNPVDSSIAWDQRNFAQTLAAVANDPGIDLILLHTGVDGGPGGGSVARSRRFEETLMRNLQAAKSDLPVPVAVVIRPPQSVTAMEATLRMQSELGQAGLAVFSSVEACAVAVRRYLDWRAAAASA